ELGGDGVRAHRQAGTVQREGGTGAGGGPGRPRAEQRTTVVEQQGAGRRAGAAVHVLDQGREGRRRGEGGRTARSDQHRGRLLGDQLSERRPFVIAGSKAGAGVGLEDGDDAVRADTQEGSGGGRVGREGGGRRLAAAAEGAAGAQVGRAREEF